MSGEYDMDIDEGPTNKGNTLAVLPGSTIGGSIIGTISGKSPSKTPLRKKEE